VPIEEEGRGAEYVSMIHRDVQETQNDWLGQRGMEKQ
jgi:hypothetical protein